ncbi:hypothetical protein GGR57DRAFT_262590 [Xylariaceae sp. FL1272]|nr:hypothetical protein GGR57DRAFT_262590 [Xylariaceae sp. FL1272]
MPQSHNRRGHAPQSASSSAHSYPRHANQHKHGKSSGFSNWFLEFSNLYNLNLRKPNSSLSVGDIRALPAHELTYYNRLKYHHARGEVDEIHRLFDKGARDIHSRWVKKPRGDPGVTPHHSDLPRATTEPERTKLLELLSKVLDGFDLSEHTPPIQLEYEVPGDELASPSLHRRTKRRSDDMSAHSPSSKKSRSEEDTTSIFSRLDGGQIRAATPLREATTPIITTVVPHVERDVLSSHQSVYGRPLSVNTSRSSFASRVFSEPDVSESHVFPSQNTEVTVEASSQDKQRRPSPPSLSYIESHGPSSSTEQVSVSVSILEATSHQKRARPAASVSEIDSLAPSSSTERALVSTFTEQNKPKANVSEPSNVVPPDDCYSDFSFDDPHLDVDPVTSNQSPAKSQSTEFEQRLQGIWPVLPTRLQRAPLAVRWEIMRVALHCDIAMDDLRIEWDTSLSDLKKLWDRLRELIPEGKTLPVETRPDVWSVAMQGDFNSTDAVVVLTASLAPNTSKTGPVFTLRLQPLKLQLPHRLDRRFGSDRFMELIMPSSYSREMARLGKPAWDSIHRWLVRDSHVFLGRVWTSFYTKPADPKKVKRDDTLLPEAVTTIMQERVYLFAENGNDFLLGDSRAALSLPRKSEPSARHTRMGRKDLLDWLLQIPQNQSQSVCKLFSRILLGLSRTRPSVVLQAGQIRHREVDILSPAGKVMNDGIARMSTALARKIRDMMGLDDIPAGYQGRFGSAKGFWIRDTEDTSGEIWIETYPSQRKWNCDYGEEDLRTFEVREESRELRCAALNLQLLPILENRAIDQVKMKEQVGFFLKNTLLLEMELQKVAMQDPAQFKLWVYDNAAQRRRQERVKVGCVPYSGGLPSNDEDTMELLLDSGFDPAKLKFLQEMAYKLQHRKCEELQKKLNVKLGCSTYAFMVIDFLGILAEDEIHLGFSSKFTDEQSGFSETFLHGMDVLVARVPAHYPSDIQKVKAVFKPELGSLKDVIIFPSKGNTPLADKLSGGDYDGDKAWVCWEPTIVNNFINADVPDTPDLFANDLLTKMKDTYHDLAVSCERTVRSAPKEVTTEFLDKAFRFNMQQNLLGTCTIYKEKLCYSRKSVSDHLAVFLSTLISHLVDRAKQGIVFSETSWAKVRKDLNAQQGDPMRSKSRLDPVVPEYKKDSWSIQDQQPSHLIDYIKFVIGKPTVKQELDKLQEPLNSAELFDADLVKCYKSFAKLTTQGDERRANKQAGIVVKPRTWDVIFQNLKSDIEAVVMEWERCKIPALNISWEERITKVSEKWNNIVPTGKNNSKTTRAMREESLANVGVSQWDLLKASFAFHMFCQKNPSMVWHIAGSQLCYLKSVEVSRAQGMRAPPVLMTPGMYAGVKPDARYVRGRAAIMAGRRMQAIGDEGEDVELDDGGVDDDA